MTFAETALPPLSLKRPPAPMPRTTPMSPIGLLFALRENPVETWTRWHYELPILTGDSVLGRVCVVNDPASLRHILVDNAANYRKDALQRRVLAPGLGNGLLTAEGDEWRAQRRALASLFTPRTVAGFSEAMRASADWLMARWEGLRNGRRIDASAEMAHVTLDVLERTIFSSGLGADPSVFSEGLTRYFNTVGRIDPLDVLDMPSWIPRIGRIRAKPTLDLFARTIDDLIAARREAMAQDPESAPRDLLTALINARDPQTGAGLSEPEIRANVITFIGAGHETTANTLSWSLFLLSEHPAWRARLEAEADAALPEGHFPEGGLERLVETRAVIEEALRLYPPAATLSREAIGPDHIMGRTIRAGTTVVIAPWVLQRHKLLWANPDLFDPSRFLPGARETIDRFAYLPFGAGPRVCIGQSFAVQEATIILATILRHYRLDLAPGHVVTPQQRVTLRPKGGLPMMLHRR